MKLFVVGQDTADPDRWSPSEVFSIVSAETADEALRLSEGFGGEIVTEIPTDQARVVFVYIPPPEP